jgi:hypothetical protein
MFFLKLFIVATLGLAFQLAMKSKSMKDTARKANVVYAVWDFLKTDLSTILITYIVLALFLVVFGPALDPGAILAGGGKKSVTFFFDLFVLPIRTIYEIFMMSVSATVGYAGMDLALRYFGRTLGFIKQAIDYKTTQADAANGTLDMPTPVK